MAADGQAKRKTLKATTEEMHALVIDELRTTEASYVKDLMYLIQAYMKPMREDRCMLPADFRKLFANVIQIFDFQKKFYKRLEAISRLPFPQQRFGQLFLTSVRPCGGGGCSDGRSSRVH